MTIFHKVDRLKKFAALNSSKWSGAGFVPTMGALHKGHISLIMQAKETSSLTIASIFVNPSQFNDPDDFSKYPVTIAHDIQLLEEAGCDVLFLPDVQEMYPDGWIQKETYELGTLENLLEGYYRPGHFQGVCQVVHRLLDIIKPATIFMGQKDFQQCMVVQRLLQLKSLPVELITCPTLRESDGLAMSSRNVRLTEEDRPKAAAIFREIQLIKMHLGDIPLRSLELNASQSLLDAGFKSIDYVSIAQPSTLIPLDAWQTGEPAVILAAAFLGDIRLIDNELL